MLLLGACGDDAPTLRWLYELPPGVEVASVEARVLAGGCEGDAVFFDAFLRGESASMPPRLDDGDYGFEIVARDAACRVVARGCEARTLPLGGELRVVAAEVSEAAECDACIAGICEQSDAGATDAGRPIEGDAGDVDGGPAADGGPPVDAGPGEDGGVDPCGECSCTGDRCEDGVCVPARPATEVHASLQHSCALAGGRLYCWGQSTVGEVGVGDFDDTVPTPRQILGSGWTALAVGNRTTCGARGDDVLCWGANNREQLGLGDGAAGNVFAPEAQPTARGVDDLAMGSEHGLAVVAGALEGWGTNANFNLGPLLARDAVQNEPLTYTGIPAVVQVDAQQWTSFVLREDGVLLSWGWNVDGELGRGGAGGSIEGPEEVGDGDWAEVRAGLRHACARKTDGRVFCWGAGEDLPTSGFDTGMCRNKEGALGIGAVSATTPELVEGISARTLSAWCSTCVVTPEDELFCFGPNVSGELGLGDTSARTEPTRVPGDWIHVSTSSVHTCGVRAGGAIYCWGDNENLVLGVDDLESTTIPARVCLP